MGGKAAARSLLGLVALGGCCSAPESPYVTTLTGTDQRGTADGPAGTAEFVAITGLAVDGAGTIYVADGNRIRKVGPTGYVTTLAGNGHSGSVDGSGGPNGTAEFALPWGIAVSRAGEVFVADESENTIRKIDPSGNAATVAGTGEAGAADGPGGPAGTATFNAPTGLALDDSGNIYVADTENNLVRRIDSSGNVKTVAGSGVAGHLDGQGSVAELNHPYGMAVDGSGNVFIGDVDYWIRKLDPGGFVTSFAGNGEQGDPVGSMALQDSENLAADARGNVYVAQLPDILKIDSRGNVTTLAGHGVQGYLDGPAQAAEFWRPSCVAVDSQGTLYVGDSADDRVGAVRIRVIHQ